MTFLFWALLILTGVVAGFSTGALGIGGGFFIVPTLYWILSWTGLDRGHALEVAIATSLGVMIFTSGGSAITHSIKRAVIWKIFFYFTMGSVVGAVLGPFLAQYLPTASLRFSLAIIEVLVGIYLILKPRPRVDTAQESAKLYTPYFFVPFGFICGLIGSLLGIGGGIFVVPTLMLLRIKARQAVATSSVCIVPLAIIALFSYYFWAQRCGRVPFSQIVSVPALIALSIAALASSPVGAYVCHKVSEKILRISLGIILIFWGIMFFL